MNRLSSQPRCGSSARPCRHLALLLAPALALLGPRPEGVSSSPRTPAPLTRNCGRIPLLGNKEAWKRLPPAEQGAGQPLPTWARALAPTLPATTAAMLELDFQQRMCSPLDPKLRAKMRWVAAHANGCAASRATAAADFLRAGGKAADLRSPGDDLAGLTEAERAALAFARKLTASAASVSDREMAHLVKLHGERRVVAMVLLVAHASFQDRLLLALGLPEDAGCSLPPLDVRFKRPRPGTRLAAPRTGSPVRPTKALSVPGKPDPEWLALDFTALGREIQKQRSRKPRIALPSGQPDAIHWGEVCRSYQPELSASWATCMRTFGAEAGQDPVFEASVFWVVTRTQESFY